MSAYFVEEKTDTKVQKKPAKATTSKTLKRILKSRTTKAVLFGCIGLICLCYAISFFTKPHVDPNVIEVSGRIECDETHMIAATGTRVTSVLVDEGEAVRKGQLLLTLDSGGIETKIGSAKKIVGQAKYAKVQADQQVNVVQQDINEARKKSKGFWAKVFTSPKGREKKAEELKRNMMQAKMMSFQAQAAQSQAQAAISEATTRISYFKLKSPIDGIVAVKSTEIGEIVGKGTVLMTLADPKSAYMRAFIAEGDLAKVNIEQKADVYLGGDDTKPLHGKVIAIDAKPSFTPQNIYFKNDRLRQSFGMKIAIDNSNGEAKPGVRADAKIFVKSEKNK
jgi:multidrug resistance efflux pump